MTASSAEPVVLTGSALHDGTASGAVLAMDTPLSFWGGTDSSGTIIDRHHPRYGHSITGRVLAMPAGRGSSSSSTVLAELLRNGTGPAAVLMTEPDAIVTLGALVAAELYATAMPVIVLAPEAFDRLGDGTVVDVEARAEHGSVRLPDTPKSS